MSLYARHKDTLDAAMAAVRSRGYWSPYPESPSPRIYGETAAAEGEAAFQALLGKPFDLRVPGAEEWVGAEHSPYGFDLGVTYQHLSIEAMLPLLRTAAVPWRQAGPEERAGVCVEILNRINKNSFLIAQAIMHTTGQGFVMSFQAGGPHAQDRGLEAVATALKAQLDVPRAGRWEKPQGKQDPIRLEKEWHIAPRGIALTVGCSTFPTWNGYPGIFASLATGNAVIVKPHPGAILPLALTVSIAREVLSEAGYDPNLILLAPDTVEAPITKDLALHPAIGIIDYTGSSHFGQWLEENARQAQVYTEKAGVNFVILESTSDFQATMRNLAFTLSLYSGQMCTTTQNILVPRQGIETDQGHISAAAVGEGLAAAVTAFLSDQARAVEVLGAIQSKATLARINEAGRLGQVLLHSQAVEHPKYPGATIRTPVIVATDAGAYDTFAEERFGPISFVVATDGIDGALDLARRMLREKGAITAGLYSTREDVVARTVDVCLEGGVNLSLNLTGNIYVNQSAAFSDFHGTGGNPAANASLTDLAYVSGRFRVVAVRRPVAA